MMNAAREHLGFSSFIPPFAAVKSSNFNNITRGINYASGAAGIREESGKEQVRTWYICRVYL